MTHKNFPNNLGKFPFPFRLHLESVATPSRRIRWSSMHFVPEEAGLKDGDTLHLSKSLTSSLFSGKLGWEVGVRWSSRQQNPGFFQGFRGVYSLDIQTPKKMFGPQKPTKSRMLESKKVLPANYNPSEPIWNPIFQEVFAEVWTYKGL